MGTAITIHFVDGDSKGRADSARLLLALGHHVEVYADLCELLRHPPQYGIIVAHDKSLPGGAEGILAALEGAGIALPLVVASESGDVRQVVEAMVSGAFDYLRLPIECGDLDRLIQRAIAKGEEHYHLRKEMIEARRLIELLSAREREVFDHLVAGASNKLIARSLGISPRTVEIHRANMMQKLGVIHVAAAVRLYLSARLGA